MNTTYSPIPSDDQSRLPGHGPSARETDLTGGRADPRASGVSGHDRDLLGAEAAMLSEGNHPGQSEFGAFLDDLSQLVRSQKAAQAGPASHASAGAQSSQAGLTDQIEQRISQARQKLTSALGSAQSQVSEVIGSAQSRVSGVIGAIGSAQDRVSGALDSAQDRVSDVIGSAQSRVSGALDSAQQVRAQATRRVRQGMDQSLDLIQERPLQAIAAAAAGGLLLGLLLSSGRR